MLRLVETPLTRNLLIFCASTIVSGFDGARDAGGSMDSDRSEGDLMSRRTVIGAAAVTVVSTGAAAQQAAPRPKGPRVWLDMDQKELDDAYDQSVYAPNRDQLNRRRASESELVRARLGAPRRVGYGATPHVFLMIRGPP